MIVRVNVAPELLRWAVHRGGWEEETSSHLAPHLSEWLTEGKRPTLKQLQKFAKDTHTPFGLLFLPQPAEEVVPIPDMRTMRNTGVYQPSADFLDTIYLCQRRQEWYREYAMICGFEEVTFMGSATVTTSIDLVASQIRSMLSFDLHQRLAYPTWRQTFRELIARIFDTGD